ncbi:nitrogen permease regulator of amino acid transport activity 3-domain-containing protein [Chaetomium fimeti]|uniref:Nitrogen permease regulator 3 n=1 Tax=Chaetomium fimeti TaxID=1854472 RepID=A0AAE0HM67_9PEZI|nr:nitrogen permease regulator of amino acid transport activity 3-domain-containing protein [Chaetomium fimeti]
MALPVLPNTDNFLGVALVINRSRDGPRFVFHYPPYLLPPGTSKGDTDGGDDVDEDDDILPGRPSRESRIETGSSSALLAAELAQWNHDDHLVTDSGTQIVPWEQVAGFPTKDLENILKPARAYHKRLFQVSLDPIYCVSYPIQVPENGVWRKKKGKEAGKQRHPQKEPGPAKREDDDPFSTDAGGSARSGGERGLGDAEKIEARDTLKPPTKSAEEAEDKKSSMTMFNLVFFLNPKKHEVKPLVDIMFTHIIKKINKAYKYCQQRSDFVWKESKRILALKDKGREDKRKMSLLWKEILSTSSLAASMQDIYEAVSQNRIAALQLDTVEGAVTHSVQIPVPFHVPDLPQEGEKGQSGVWLTTANSLMGEEAAETPGFLDKNFALLLMMDEKRVTAELQNDPDETTLAMIEFVRHCKPTLSFYQVFQQSSNILTPAQVRKFAQHFIFWRRAIAIPPLHARDMYIVSPNCDLQKLPQAATQWARHVAPRPYKLHCPSKAHRPVYMAMLAWLMRGGWVTQLCTFAYVVVWPEIIYEVEYAQEAEEIAIARAKRAQNMGREAGSVESDDATTAVTVTTPGDQATPGSASGFLPLLSDLPGPSRSTTSLRDLSLSFSQSPLVPTSSTPTSPATRTNSIINNTTTTTNNHHPYTPSATPPPQGPSQPPTTTTHPDDDDPNNNNNNHHSPTDNPEPTPAEQAAEKARLARLADKAARALAERATAHARKAVPQATAHPSVNRARHLAGMAPQVILDAKKATGKESLYLSAIGRRFRDRVAAPAGDGRRGEGGGGGGLDGNGNGGGGGGGDSSGTAGRGGMSRLGAAHSTGGGGIRDTGDWDERVANAWPVLCKYFNGRSALERIALQEDMKRKDVWNLLTAMSEYLLCVRHW